MDITVNKTINYAVDKIVINAIMLNLFQNRLDISAPFEWKNAEGTTIKRSVQRITEVDLLTMDSNNSVLIGKLKAILPATGTMKNMSIRFADTVTARANYNNIVAKKWETISYTQEQLETLLNSQGLSVEAVKQTVSGLAITLT